MSRAIYSRWYCGHVCAGFCKSTLGTRELREMAFQKSRNFISEFWWDPWTKLSYIEMVVMTQKKISPGICYQPCGQVLSCFNCHHRGYINDPIFWNLELHASGIVTLLSCWNLCWIKPQKKLWMELKPHWFKKALARNGFPGTCTKFMMTSSNGNIFCVTFPLWHVCSGFLGTLKIREFLKMALEK